MLFLSVRGFSDYAGPTVHSRLAWLPFCLPPTRNEVGILIYGLFAAHLQETPHDVPCKTRGQDGFATFLGSVDILPDEGMPQAIEVVGKTEQQGLANLYR